MVSIQVAVRFVSHSYWPSRLIFAAPLVRHREPRSRGGLMMFKRRVFVVGMTSTALVCTIGALQAQAVAQQGHRSGLDIDVPTATPIADDEGPDKLYLTHFAVETDPDYRSLAFRLPTMPVQRRETSSQTLMGAGIGLLAGFTLGLVLDHVVEKVWACDMTGCYRSTRNHVYFYRVAVSALGTVSGALIASRGEAPSGPQHRVCGSRSNGCRLPE